MHTNHIYTCTICGHSYEFDDNNNWHIIEKFAEQIGNREDIWYATNIEIFDYIKAYDSLVFSISGNYVFNPSYCTVWFEKDGKTISVSSRETKNIKA